MEPAVDGTAWTLARLDQDCKTSSGGPRLDYFGIQYYNSMYSIYKCICSSTSFISPNNQLSCPTETRYNDKALDLADCEIS